MSNHNVFVTMGASNHSSEERELNDYYATEPKATELLLQCEKFTKQILEPCCGEGHISKVLENNGYNVTSYDIIDRDFGEVKDFFEIKEWNTDIITNPPYKSALEFVKHSLEIIPNGNKVAMFLRIQFLEGKARGIFYKDNPPARVYVARSRLRCAKNGHFDTYGSSAVAFCWFVWEKGFKGNTIIKWMN